MTSHTKGDLASLGPWSDYERTPGARSVKSAERTLLLFELFALHQRPLTVGEISKLLGVPQPSVTMLLRNLVKMGYVEHSRYERTYVPTIRIMLLGSWIHRRFSSFFNLEHYLDELLESVGETVVLGIQNGIYSQYVSSLVPEDPNHLTVQSGLLRPITRTAIGRMLLSLKTDKEIDLLVRRCNAEVLEDRLRVNASELLVLINEIRRCGYARTRGDMTLGYGAIAIAISARIGQIPLAIGVGGPIDRIERKLDQIVSALNQCKSALERRADVADAEKQRLARKDSEV